MATYKQIQEHVKAKHGYTVKSCWIAHCKELNGLPVKMSSRRYNPKVRQIPCPSNKREVIEEAFRHFKML